MPAAGPVGWVSPRERRWNLARVVERYGRRAHRHHRRVGLVRREQTIRTMAVGAPRPSCSRCRSDESGGGRPCRHPFLGDVRHLVSTGSHSPVVRDRVSRSSQANNVFVFPGVGLGAIVAEATAISERMFLGAARALAGRVSEERLADGVLYPPIEALIEISRTVALAVASEAVRSGAASADAASRAPSAEAVWTPGTCPHPPAPCTPPSVSPEMRYRERGRPWPGRRRSPPPVDARLVGAAPAA
jgi:hypothetical protein